MKTTKLFQLPLALMTSALFAVPCHAAPFNSGSDGSFGDLIVTNEISLPLPTNGVLNCRKVMVTTNGVLKFQRNALNTPVMLLATEEVVIEGKIILDGMPGGVGFGGAGGPGGFDGGRDGQGGFLPAYGKGPGGGPPGVEDPNNGGRGMGSGASFATTGNGLGAPTYGDALLLPLAGGSGGGGDVLHVANGGGGGGGGGGGAILIASNVRIALLAPFGRIQANGGRNPILSLLNAGSGGAIRLVAPIIEGSGGLQTHDGNPTSSGLGRGRIRLDSPNQSNASFSMIGVWTRGVLMLPKLPIEPRLDIIQVADQNIPPGEPALVVLPSGSPSQRQVIVQAKDFNDSVPIRVALSLDYGAPVFVDATITNTTQNPATVSVPVTFPINAPVTVNVWTR